MSERTLNLLSVMLGLMLVLPITHAVWEAGDTNEPGDVNVIYNSTPSVSGAVQILTPENRIPVAVIGDLITGYKGYYYNLPADHPDVEGEITGVVTGDSPFNHDWYDDQYFSFQSVDGNLTFGSSWFPVDEGMEGDPQYFAVHWQANISVPAEGEYSFQMGSDDDSWLYIDDIMTIDLGGVHALEEDIGSINLTAGTHSLDIYFAERHLVQSGFYFEFLNETIEIVSTVIWDDVIADIDEPVLFEGSCSYDIDGTIVSHDWNFGDGSTGTGPAPEHSYSQSGIFTVILTVTDDAGAIDTDTCLVNIINRPPMAVAGEDQALFFFETAYFNGSGSYDEGGEIVDHYWDFGDGISGSGMLQQHVYGAVGEYAVTLTVTDNMGMTGSDICIVTVHGIPNLAYEIEYLDPVDETIVNGTGIYFHTSGAYPDKLTGVGYNETYWLPESDHGTYFLYNRSTPVHFVIRITNLDDAAHTGITVKARQEFHNTVTLWDRYGELDLLKGEPLDGDSTSIWTINNIGPGETVQMEGYYWSQGRGWGLDQTHITIFMDGIVLVDDPEAGVYCPP